MNFKEMYFSEKVFMRIWQIVRKTSFWGYRIICTCIVFVLQVVGYTPILVKGFLRIEKMSAHDSFIMGLLEIALILLAVLVTVCVWYGTKKSWNKYEVRWELLINKYTKNGI